MGIEIGSNFDMQAALPMDSRTVVADVATRDAIPLGVRYIGLECYVESESTRYLWNGSVWVEQPTTESANSDSIINALIFG